MSALPSSSETSQPQTAHLSGEVALPPPLRQRLLRRLSYIMLVRVLLFSLLLGGTVVLYVLWGAPEELAGPSVTVLFVFITVILASNIVYAMLLRRVDLNHMARIQLVVDLLTSAVLVHFTGGAESAFVLFFLLSPIAAAVTLGRRAALSFATAAIAVFCGVSALGYLKLLPVLPGQVYVPWAMQPSSFARSLLINCGAMLAVSALAGYLANLLSSASARVERQLEHIADLAALHADVVRCLTSGLLTIDLTGRVLTLNRAAAEMLGVTGDSVVGRPLSELWPDLARLARAETATRRAEVSLERGGRRLVLGVSVSALSDRDNRAIGRILNFQDLTSLRELEQTIERSEHLAALGRVAAGVAHEIRNPLASISGSLELLAQAAELRGDDRRLMQIAQREIERLDAMIADLLDYARPKPPGSRRPLDLAAVVPALVESIGDLLSAPDAPRLEVSPSSSDLWVHADPDQLKGVLWNLVSNAWQAGEHELVEVAVDRKDDSIRIAVRDRGCGIAPDELAHIFEPFYSSKDKGSGLGLAIVQRTVHDHGGTIDAESTPGKGTCFVIALPSIEPPPDPDAARESWLEIPEIT